MGSEISNEENNDYQNGDVKKDDDLHVNSSETNENDKEIKPTEGEKHHNGDVRNRKPGKGGNRTKADMKKALLKSKPLSRKEQPKSFVPKWLSTVNAFVNGTTNKVPWTVKLLLFCGVVALAFATRLFNITLPSHIW